MCFPELLGRGTDTASLRWYSSDEAVLSINDGLLRAIATGHARVAVYRADSGGTSDFTVVPPVATIRFERPVYEFHVGDTVRIRAWAYDSAGGRVQLLLPESYLAGKDYPIRPHPPTIHGATWDLVEGIRVGRSVASVSMAHRRDTALIVVSP